MDQGLETGVRWAYLDTRWRTRAASLQGGGLTFDYYSGFCFSMHSKPLFRGDVVAVRLGTAKHMHDTA